MVIRLHIQLDHLYIGKLLNVNIRGNSKYQTPAMFDFVSLWYVAWETGRWSPVKTGPSTGRGWMQIPVTDRQQKDTSFIQVSFLVPLQAYKCLTHSDGCFIHLSASIRRKKPEKRLLVSVKSLSPAARKQLWRKWTMSRKKHRAGYRAVGVRPPFKCFLLA